MMDGMMVLVVYLMVALALPVSWLILLISVVLYMFLGRVWVSLLAGVALSVSMIHFLLPHGQWDFRGTESMIMLTLSISLLNAVVLSAARYIRNRLENRNGNLK